MGRAGTAASARGDRSGLAASRFFGYNLNKAQIFKAQAFNFVIVFMRQIDIIKAYSQKRCLIVNANPDERAYLKRCLVDSGGRQIDTAGHAQEAVDLCQRSGYDLVISDDNNLGKGKNGQQLLEELRYEGLLRNSAIFILTTSETISQNVIHALEYQPDAYLRKPYSREHLRPRLDAALLQKEALIEVYRALDLKHSRTAIQACRDLTNQGGRYRNEATKMLGELLCQRDMFDEAFSVYADIDEAKRPLWARLGYARACIGVSKLDEAEAALKATIDSHPHCVDAHDLAARVLAAQGKPEQAQQALVTAVSISPKSTSRQRELGRISAEVGDDHVAAHAFRAAIRCGKNSRQERAEDYLDLAQTLLAMAHKGSDPVTELTTEALATLEQLDKKFHQHLMVQMRRHLLDADIHHLRGDSIKSTAAHEEALKLFADTKFSAMENTSTQLCIDCAEAFMARGCYDEGERLLQALGRHNSDHHLAVRIDKLLREPVTKEGIAYAATLNKRGIDFHNVNKFDEAIEAFRRVLDELPNHIGLNLNLVQAMVSKSHQTGLSDRELSLLASCLQRVGQIPENSQYRQRLDYLAKRARKILNQARD